MAHHRPHLPSDPVLKALRGYGLTLPGAHTKSPWPGHLDLAVNGKTFAYLTIEGAPFSISCKLPQSRRAALQLPFTKPTGYGLGKSNWVSADFGLDEVPPLDLFKAWIEESYRAQAPKKYVAALSEQKREPQPNKTAKALASPRRTPKATRLSTAKANTAAKIRKR